MGCSTHTCMCGCSPPRPCVSTGPKKARTTPNAPGAVDAATPSGAPSLCAAGSAPSTCSRNSSIIRWNTVAWLTGSAATRRSISTADGISGASCSIRRHRPTSAPSYSRLITRLRRSAGFTVVKTSGAPNSSR